MSSISVPCPKCSVAPRHGSWRPNSQQGQNQMVSICNPRPSGHAGSTWIPLLQAFNRSKSPILKAQANEVAFESSSNSSPVSSTELETLSSNGRSAEVAEESTGQVAVTDSAISTFMAEVSDLVKLVDSRDITELQLKRKDCELIIRKKEALLQPAPTASYVMMQPPQQAAYPSHTPFPAAVPPLAPAGPPSPSAPAALPSMAKGSKSSLPPLKCPMAGTLYRCPAPGEPPFVKVGDKIQKGQVVCIIEAMKLMNEIEADQSGTVVELLVEDGKPVSVDMPLLIIEP